MALQASSLQIALPGFCTVEAAVEKLASSGVEERGAVYTKREVVDFILDLVGYNIDKPLHKARLLEPSFGGGDFLIPALMRLLEAYKKHRTPGADPIADLTPAIRAVELHRESFSATRNQLHGVLADEGFTAQERELLLDSWLSQGDFLLTELPAKFTHVVGNPPYVRQELIPDELWTAYRSRYETIFDRADIYIPFIEKSLRHLAPSGVLGFICADRWMKNKYGGPLRRLVSDNFRLKFYVDMVDTPAFHTDVIAYPAITVISNEPGGSTRVTYRPEIKGSLLRELYEEMMADSLKPQGKVKEITGVTAGSEPWLLESLEQLALVRRLEASLPTVEDAGCKVGIGVATGADKAFIGLFEEMDVEPDRKLPLVMTRDIASGKVAWRGYGVINPFGDDGKLVDLKNYPKLARYLEARREIIGGRHISKKNPTGWYRTIDRIYAELTNKPKLLVPDIKGEAHIVFEEGRYYPHHNLYYITSDEWDLEALQAVLMSGIARLFVSLYSTKMRGGYLRFQAQYLRRIRIPRWSDIPADARDCLMKAVASGDQAEREAAVYKVFNLTKAEIDTLIAMSESKEQDAHPVQPQPIAAQLPSSKGPAMKSIVDLEEQFIDELVRRATSQFWTVRTSQSSKQKAEGLVNDLGGRSEVTGGGHMDAYLGIFATLARACGYTNSEIFFKESVSEDAAPEEDEQEPVKNKVTLPGFFRPTKQWDLVIVRKNTLVAVIECKGIASSFGKNMNNRTEEALGSADDINQAVKAKTFGEQITPPWVGYLFVIAKVPPTTIMKERKNKKTNEVELKPTKVAGSIESTLADQTHFKIRPEFLHESEGNNAPGVGRPAKALSYIDRAKELCKKLVSEKRYSAAGLLAVTPTSPGDYEEPDPRLGMKQLLLSFKNHLEYSKEVLK